jgi:hypothetical protein
MIQNNKEQKKKTNAEWYQNNKEQAKKTRAKWYQNNKERAKKTSAEWYQNNKEQEKKKKKEWYQNNKEQEKKKKKEWYLNNKEQANKNSRKWQKNNKEKIKIWENNRYKTDINFRLKKILRGRIRKALKGKDKSITTLELIGCTINELKKHLESKFKSWMNWENQGRGGWDIDHIIAMSKFDLNCPVQQHACCHWSNLQPMEHIANIKKGDK